MIDLTGQKFNRLKVIKYSHKDKRYRPYWKCLCNCGRISTVSSINLTSGQVRSCGCLLKEKTKKMGESRKVHGMSRKRIYKIWDNMKDRCLNKNSGGYKWYGKRGITICRKWLKFEGFYNDMKNGYAENLQLDRINNNQGYKKSNCRWVTLKENLRNKRNNRRYKNKCVSEWSEITGIKINLIHLRLRRGWDWERILKTPVRNYNK